jgi:anaerobic ribonucleoside-triphosphate reductase activating protein
MAAYLPVTEALGPGRRFALWVQGCCFNCPGCVAPAWIPQITNQLISVISLAERIAQTPELAGMTLSGGEPMLQAEGLSALIDEVHLHQPHFTVICYTGFRLEQLQRDNNPARLALLQRIDVLIDGVYLQDQNYDIGLRGSSNQCVHFLSGVYTEQAEQFTQASRRLEFHLSNPDNVLMVGIPPRQLPEHFNTFLKPVL